MNSLSTREQFALHIMAELVCRQYDDIHNNDSEKLATFEAIAVSSADDLLEELEKPIKKNKGEKS